MIDRLSRLGPISAAAIGLVTLLAVAVVDLATGTELSFSLFYLGPIAFYAWRTDLLGGVVASAIGAGTWYAIGILGGERHSHALIPLWNAMVRFGFFVIVSLLLVKLRRTMDHERSLARTDPLTGLPNRRTLMEQTAIEIARAQRTGRPISFAFIDLDNFKAVNDRFGHAAGDELLKQAASAIDLVLRSVDIRARVGGDEFAIALPDTDAEAAREIVARLSAAFSAVGIAMSIGAAVFETAPVSVEAALSYVDSLMYEVKAQRSDRAEVRIVREPALELPAHP